MISIIVPVYNAAEFVSATIENLLLQDVDKEILLVNDGSTDDSLRILQNYAKSYDCIRVIDKPNGGVSSARNIGIKAVNGEYVIFVDSDDLLEERTLERALDVFTEDVECVFFSYKHVASDNHIISSISYLPTGKYTLQEWTNDAMSLINTHIVSCIGTKVYRTSVLRGKGMLYNEDISHLEDISFCFTYLTFVNKLYYINEALYCYMHANSNSLFRDYCYNLPQSTEFCIDRVVHVIPIERCSAYVTECLWKCIQNEAIYDIVEDAVKIENLYYLSQSKYISYLKTSVIGSFYYQLLTTRRFHLLLLLYSAMPRTRAWIWNVFVKCVVWVKKILNVR